MRRTVVATALVVMVLASGCAGITDSGASDPTTTLGEPVEVGDSEPNATNVTQTVQIAVDGTTNGTEWTALGATYPRENFSVHPATHDELTLGVDRTGDGELDREFNETHVSGVNTNAYSFDVILDTDYTLEAGDVVVVEYPAVDSPEEAGEYEVEVRLNDRQTANATLSIE